MLISYPILFSITPPTTTECKRNEMLPDHDYRRGLHLAKSWSCSDCEKPKQPFDSERNLHDKIITAFSELLERSAPDLCDSYCGKEDTKMGDGYLALPTLIHCGPGRALSCAEPRYMLFFTLRPKYTGIKRGRQTQQHQYNPNDQYHAGKLGIVVLSCCEHNLTLLFRCSSRSQTGTDAFRL